MKRLISLVAIMCLIAGFSVAAPNGFEVHKWSSVTGDWAWDGSSWQNGEFLTGNYEMTANTKAVKNNAYFEVESAGTPWKYDLEQHTFLGGKGKIENSFNVMTLNDPETTPATGGYTKYNFETHNYGEFTESHLIVKGQGYATINAVHKAGSSLQQDAYVSVN